MKTEKTKAPKKKSVRTSSKKKETTENKSVQSSLKSSASKNEVAEVKQCCISHKCLVAAVIFICMICGACMYGKRITKSVVDYMTPYVWQITANYEGESVCLMHMQDEETIAANKEKIIPDIQKTRQTCKCLHNIAVKNGVTDFGNFIRVISEDGKLTKDWMHKKIDGEETPVENSYMKTWMEFWLRDIFTDCE